MLCLEGCRYLQSVLILHDHGLEVSNSSLELFDGPVIHLSLRRLGQRHGSIPVVETVRVSVILEAGAFEGCDVIWYDIQYSITPSVCAGAVTTDCGTRMKETL